jgi:hypothetical protein
MMDRHSSCAVRDKALAKRGLGRAPSIEPTVVVDKRGVKASMIGSLLGRGEKPGFAGKKR